MLIAYSASADRAESIRHYNKARLQEDLRYILIYVVERCVLTVAKQSSEAGES